MVMTFCSSNQMQQNINLTKEHNEVDVYDCNTNDVKLEEEDNTIKEGRC